MYPVHEIRCGWTMVVALILKLLKLQKVAEKLPCTFYVHAYLIFYPLLLPNKS